MGAKLLAKTAGALVLVSLAVTGCGTTSSSNQTTSNTATTATSNSTTANQTMTNSTKANSTMSNSTNSTMAGNGKTSAATSDMAMATLSPTKGSTVKGTATLTLNPKTHVLTVLIKASGLAPNSVHAEHIHSGTVAKTGPILYPLENLTANKSGDATSTTMIQNVKSIPTTGWVINIHESLKNFKVLASGNVMVMSK